ncbi:hypothetical protein SAMN05421743_110116 [Thalassobacillus cyri]|uniref:Uncharacterized protein n=1 Tax=Thalassobacillus cyri TaxID=571932 RepID=A0A1H4F6B1_9BACI|nr:hypothetical protein SAMN05421743_110116 [Thalassobacillus cyri]
MEAVYEAVHFINKAMKLVDTPIYDGEPNGGMM